MRILAICLTLTACTGCASQPIAPNAQAQIATLEHRYAAKLAKAHGLCTPLCYVAAKDLVMANTERTATSIAVADEMLTAWETEE